MMKQQHWRTTLFGMLLAAALYIHEHPAIVDNNARALQIAGLVEVVAALGVGVTAADGRTVKRDDWR